MACLINNDIIAAPEHYSWALVMLEIGKHYSLPSEKLLHMS